MNRKHKAKEIVLGEVNGGTEVGAHASRRPAPTGITRQSLFYIAFCATMLSLAMAAEGAGVSGGTLSTEGAQVPLPPLPYAESGDRVLRSLLGAMTAHSHPGSTPTALSARQRSDAPLPW